MDFVILAIIALIASTITLILLLLYLFIKALIYLLKHWSQSNHGGTTQAPEAPLETHAPGQVPLAPHVSPVMHDDGHPISSTPVTPADEGHPLPHAVPAMPDGHPIQSPTPVASQSPISPSTPSQPSPSHQSFALSEHSPLPKAVRGSFMSGHQSSVPFSPPPLHTAPHTASPFNPGSPSLPREGNEYPLPGHNHEPSPEHTPHAAYSPQSLAGDEKQRHSQLPHGASDTSIFHGSGELRKRAAVYSIMKEAKKIAAQGPVKMEQYGIPGIQKWQLKKFAEKTLDALPHSVAPSIIEKRELEKGVRLTKRKYIHDLGKSDVQSAKADKKMVRFLKKISGNER